MRQILALPAEARAVTFFQLVADWEEAWGLKDPVGWIVSRETDALPLWPHSAFAEACARGAWAGAAPAATSLGELLDHLVPLLAEYDLQVAVFPTPEDAGIVMPAGELRSRMEKELELGES